jgi:EAL domain-containing protein (putative c-di-GMP-specific phosphodiesterase class I)
MEESRYERHDMLTFFQPRRDGYSEEEMRMLMEIHRDSSSGRENFLLRYQPILDLRTGRLTGAEALLRWKGEEYGEVSPGRFIPFLENDPGYSGLGYDILRRAVRWGKKMQASRPDFRINVNITAIQLLSDDFIANVVKILEEEKFDPAYLMLELTERCKEMEFDILKQRVNDLREAGFRVALDDMGTGFSSIDLLLHLNVNEIKLDMQFTQHMRENENDPKFAELLVALAEENDMLLCFEGVETEEQRDYLKRFGRVLFQGYYYDRPLRIEEFTAKYCE